MAQPVIRSSLSSLSKCFCRKAMQMDPLKTMSSPTVQHVKHGSTKKGSRVLSHSTLLLQDGLDIQELPLVIRKMEAREFPFTTAMYAGESLRKVTEEDEAFKLQLMDCVTLRQVFKLLEVPGDKVTAYSAAFALQRLCSLQQGIAEELQSFIRKAILNELCETVMKGLHGLSNETIVNLVKCYLVSSNYEHRHIDAINEEVERRIGDGVFKIGELCSLVDLLSGFASGDQELANNIWIHLGSRYAELDQTNLNRVYGSIKYLPPSQKFVWKVLDKQVDAVWWKFGTADVALILQRMMLCNHYHSSVLQSFGKWLIMNIHDVRDTHLKEFVAAYTYFKFSDANVMKALERYVSAKAGKMDKLLLAMIMEYCRQRQYASPRIFDAVAIDFVKNGHKYSSQEMLHALRPFGHLNYVPPNATQLFLMVEDVLTRTFGDFDAASIIELLTSFVYIERFPINFLNKVFTPHFLAKVKTIPHLPIRQRAGRFLIELQAAVLLEFPRHYIKPVNGGSLGLTLTWLESRYFRFHLDINNTLASLLGHNSYHDVELPRHTPHIIDFQINVDDEKNIIKMTKDSRNEDDKKLALIGLMPEHFCVNTKHLIGEQAMKKRHLERLGYTVIPISYEIFTWRCERPPDKETYIRRLLEPHLKIPEVFKPVQDASHSTQENSCRSDTTSFFPDIDSVNTQSVNDSKTPNDQ